MFCFVQAKAQSVSRYPDRYRILQRGHLFQLDPFAGNTTHLHQFQIKLVVIYLRYYCFLPGLKLGKPLKCCQGFKITFGLPLFWAVLISFHFETPVTLTERTALKQFLKDAFRRQRRSVSSLRYIFCSDAYLLDINRTNLQHDYLTDIITFNWADETSPVEGEVYISVDRARAQVAEYGVSLQEELHRLIFHGALHLCGYRDKTAKEQKEMTAMENRWLKDYGIVPRGTKP